MGPFDAMYRELYERDRMRALAHRPFWSAVSWRACVVLVLCVGWAGLTHHRVQVWQTDLRLWTDAAAKAPFKPRPVMNEGRMHELAGDVEFADAAYRRVISLSFDPRRSAYNRRFSQAAAETNLAHLAMKQGKFATAMRILDNTIADWPEFPYAHYNRGAILWTVGACADAWREYGVAMTTDPTLPAPKGSCEPKE